MHKRTFIGMVEAGEPLIQQAVDALREYHQAQDRGAPADEVEHLHLLAESLFQAVTDYQVRVIAKIRGTEAPLGNSRRWLLLGGREVCWFCR